MLKKTLLLSLTVLSMGFTWFKYDNLDEGIKPYPRLADTLRIKADLTAITQTERPRNYRNNDILNKTAAYIQSEFLKGPPSVSEQKFKASNLQGIDFSDHLNYWQFGYSAVMITNTAFYRNKNYHQKEDTLEKLNIGNIGLVVDGVFRALIKLN